MSPLQHGCPMLLCVPALIPAQRSLSGSRHLMLWVSGLVPCSRAAGAEEDTDAMVLAA